MYPEYLQDFIPPGFDLINYQETANMDLIQWLDNLLLRRKAYRTVLEKDYEFNLYKCNSDLESDQILHKMNSDGLSEFECFKKDVLRNVSDGAFIKDIIRNIVNAYVDEDSRLETIVSELNYVDLISLEKAYLTDEVRDKYSRIKPSLIPLATEMSYGDLRESIFSYNENNEVESSWLKVAMGNSDSEIKDAFNDWLKEYREKHKPIRKEKRRVHKLKTINKTTLRKWHDAKVLAYIDVVSWNFLMDQKITNSILGQIIYPEPKLISDRTKMIDDTTKPYAEKLTSETFITRLKKIAIYEKRKEKL